MSKDITINLGQRDPDDERRLIKTILRSAPPGSRIEVNAQHPVVSEPPTSASSQTSAHARDVVEQNLEEDEQNAKAEPPPANDSELAKNRAERTTHGRGRLMTIYDNAVPVIYRVVVEELTKETVKKLIENAGPLYVIIKEYVKDQISKL